MTDYILNKVSWTVKSRLEELFRMMVEYKRNILFKDLSPKLGEESNSEITRAENLRKFLLNTYFLFSYYNGELYKYLDNNNDNEYLGIVYWNSGNNSNNFRYIDYNNQLSSISTIYGDLKEILIRINSIFPLSSDATFNKDLFENRINIPEYSDKYSDQELKSILVEFSDLISETLTTSFSELLANRQVYLISFVDFLTALINYLNNQGFVFSFTTSNNSIGYTLKDLDSIELLPGTSLIDPKDYLIEFNFRDIYSDYIKLNLLDIESIKITPTLTSVGIGTKINTNLLARDFQTAKKELINFIGTNYPQIWNDFYDGNVGTIFLDILSYLHDILNNYIDRSQRESYPLTAQETENLEDWIKFMGIQIPGVISASTIIKVGLVNLLQEGGSDVKLFKENGLIRKLQIYPEMNLREGKTFEAVGPNGLTYCYFPVNNDNTIEILNNDSNPLNYIYVPLKEGTVVVESFIAKGETFETYTTKQYPVADKSFLVFRKLKDTNNFILLKFLESFRLFDKSSTADGVYEYNKDGALTLYFGGSNYGLQLKAGDEVTVVYLKSNGNKGNELGKDYFKDLTIPIKFLEYDSGGNLLKEIPQEEGIECLIEGNDPGSGGANVYITPEMMPAFVGLSQATNRLVTELDYDYFLETFQSKQGGRIKAKAFLNINNKDFRNANIIFIPALIYSSEGIFKEFNTYWDEAQQKRIYPPIIQELYDEIEERKMITDRIEILSGIAQEIELKIILETSTGLNKDEIKKEIEKRIKEYFMKIGFGKFGKLSDLYYISESVLTEKDKTFDNIINNSISISWRYNKVYDVEKNPKNNTLSYISDGNSKIKALDYLKENGGEFWLLNEEQDRRVSVIFGSTYNEENLNKITALVPIFNWTTLYKPLQKKIAHIDNKFYNNNNDNRY